MQRRECNCGALGSMHKPECNVNKLSEETIANEPLYGLGEVALLTENQKEVLITSVPQWNADKMCFTYSVRTRDGIVGWCAESDLTKKKILLHD